MSEKRRLILKSSKKNWLKNINKQQLALEFLSVVFAVILALVLNSWRESYKLNESLKQVKTSIKQEAIRNDSLIQQSYTYRKAMLERFYQNNNLITAFSLQDLPLDTASNAALEAFFKVSILFGQKQNLEPIKVVQEENLRVLVLGKNVYDLVIESDSIKLFGIGNIRLKVPDLSNRSWDLANATGTIGRMDVALVESLSILNTLIDTYGRTGNNALQMIYSGNQTALLSVIEDMHYIESQIIEENKILIELLK